MKLIINKNRLDSHPFENHTYLENRIGFWATVTEVNAESNTVRVISDTKQEYDGIPVVSREWVSSNDNYVTGARNLPPVGSWVFVLTPTRTITGSFVLCSGYTRGDSSNHVLFEKDKEKISAKKTVGGWLLEENYDNGDVKIANNDETISLTLENSEEGKITLKANETTVTIEKNNVSLNIKGDISLETDENLILKAKKIQMNPNGISSSLEVV